MNEIEQRLEELERLGLSRRLRMVSGPQGPRVLLDGKPVLLLCSNNYLGLADHPRVREAAAEAAMRWGVGAGASRLVSGTMTIHRRLEERLAAFEGSEACVLFGSGYLANPGAIGALAGRGDTVFSDELNHASIVDGCRLSRARGGRLPPPRRRAPRVGAAPSRAASGRRLIVTDSVFSMDGDVAPLAEIVELARGARRADDRRRGARHRRARPGRTRRGRAGRTGGRGRRRHRHARQGARLLRRVCVRAAQETVRYLINTARPLIFSTAPPPPAVAGALAALELLEERPHRVRRLRSNARVLRRALAAEGIARCRSTEMHIVPLIVGDERAAMRLCEAALERGVFAQAIRPPTVAAGHLAAAPGGDGLATPPMSCASAARALGEAGAAAAWTSRTPSLPGAAWTPGERLRPISTSARGPQERRRSTSSATRRSPRGLAPSAQARATCAGCSSPAPTRASARRS